VTAALATAALAFAASAFAQNYIILYKQDSAASDAAATIKQAGGSVIATYPQNRGGDRSLGIAELRRGSVEGPADRLSRIDAGIRRQAP
jgi:hypothetical protein